ncbi:histidinol-phosphate transaminase [Algirhabdus cladophorae]|uniref:histidinol-phosphate transaminase n=1 Tax=Algirhabdus cladophorae TaxID=3377108 RepID=UPI003B848FF4
MTQIAAQPGIMEIALYKGGKSHVDGLHEVIKLSSNENPFGPSPKAIAAYQAVGPDLHRYPSTDHADLRAAIGARYDLDPEQIICGVGSDEIITFLCQAFAGPGDEVLHTEHGFSMYKISALAAGATPVEVKERDRVTDVDALLAGVTDKTRLVFIANPNNPTTTMIGGNEVARLADGLPDNCLLVLDGAYAEFAEGYDGGAALVQSRENVVMTRTFSKLHGLGGLRVGWGYAPEAIIDVLNRVRGPFNLSNGALAAAEAAIQDTEFSEKCLAENARLRAWLASELAAIGLPSDTSQTNFLLVRMADHAEALAADEFLQSKGILIRRVESYKLPNFLRITVGTQSECEKLVAALKEFKS